ncbi:MAG: hypothetical protein CVU54_15080 [Deltaproteobacteria bacterium HGW-Deltaproteobacteria-12]|jgi:hypothetical protein|nr:MAG: hypothetical protein CVU54_15080 [Deltaproteobacteria bacterium HGW-Deltaproteobacteria-12]
MNFHITTLVKKVRIVLSSLALISVSLAVFSAPLSFAADVSTFAGGEYDGRGQGFSFLGIDLTQRINETFAVSAKLMPSYLTYEYYSGNNLIKASSPGLSTVAGIKLFWGKTMVGIYGGGEFRDTKLTPDDPGASGRGNTSAGIIQGEVYAWITSRINFSAFGSYSGISNYSYEKAGIKYQLTNLDYKEPYTLYVGIDQFFGKNADYQGEGYGGLVELLYHPLNIFVGLRGGLKHDSTFGDGGYWGLQLYKGF